MRDQSEQCPALRRTDRYAKLRNATGGAALSCIKWLVLLLSTDFTTNKWKIIQWNSALPKKTKFKLKITTLNYVCSKWFRAQGNIAVWKFITKKKLEWLMGGLVYKTTQRRILGVASAKRSCRALLLAEGSLGVTLLHSLIATCSSTFTNALHHDVGLL